MELTFIANAGCIYEHDGYRLVCDPWLTDGAFAGAWFHSPPLKTKARDLRPDALYISHLHPDHFDVEVLKELPRSLPVVYLDHGGNYLHRMLRTLGYKNLIGLKDGTSARLGPFALTMYAPFQKHTFHESQVGNLIDSALVVATNECSLFNANDNTPNLEAAKRLRDTHGRFTVAQLNYNAAGPFPSCFNNLSESEKHAAHDRTLARNLTHLVELSRILEPEYVMPFAGAYVIGGRQWKKNVYLGTTTWDDAAAFLQRHVPDVKTLVLREGMTFSLSEGSIMNAAYVPIDKSEQSAYIQNTLARKPYPFDSLPVPDMAWFRETLPIARQRLWGYQERYGVFPDLTMSMRLAEDCFFVFNWSQPATAFLEHDWRSQPFLGVSVDLRLLGQILRREEHWNNAEIGCHIDFVRVPDDYLPDVHTLLSFFHA
jgi:UDP-MurNAc hydroxylase